MYPGRSLWVSEVLWSHHSPDRLFAAFNGYRHDHFAPYLYTSEDNGRSWSKLGDNGSVRGGLPMEPINALAESEDIEGLLFCGTDGGLYVSLDAGATWSLAHPDLPRSPVHDLVIQERENELVIGTHGRSIWVLDIAPLIEGMAVKSPSTTDVLTVSPPEPLAWQEGWGQRGYGWGEAWEPEVTLPVFLPNNGDYTLEIKDSTGVGGTLQFEALRRGWQNLSFVPKDGAGTEFLPTGAYTLTLSSASDPARRAQTDWSIVDSE